MRAGRTGCVVMCASVLIAGSGGVALSALNEPFFNKVVAVTERRTTAAG